MQTHQFVCISHAMEDRRLAVALCGYLEDRGIACKLAEEMPPGSDAWLIVVVFSWFANDSPEVISQVERAFHRKTPIIPFSIEDIPPAPPLQYFLSKLHWIFAHTGKPESFFEEVRLRIGPKQPAGTVNKSPVFTRKAAMIIGLILAGGVGIYFINQHLTNQENKPGQVQLADSSGITKPPSDSAYTDVTDTSQRKKDTVDKKKDIQQEIKPLIDENINLPLPIPPSANSTSAKALEGAIFKSESPFIEHWSDSIHFTRVDGNRVRFHGELSSNPINGIMVSKGNQLIIKGGKVSGDLSILENGEKITGSIDIKDIGSYNLTLKRVHYD
jgi:hypothetical protein